MDELDRAHRLLGTRPGCTHNEARRAFRALAKQHHPDAGGDGELFDALRTALLVVVERGTRPEESAIGTMPSEPHQATVRTRAAAAYAPSGTAHLDTSGGEQQGGTTASPRPRRTTSSFSNILARHLANASV